MSRVTEVSLVFGLWRWNTNPQFISNGRKHIQHFHSVILQISLRRESQRVWRDQNHLRWPRWARRERHRHSWHRLSPHYEARHLKPHRREHWHNTQNINNRATHDSVRDRVKRILTWSTSPRWSCQSKTVPSPSFHWEPHASVSYRTR